MIRTNLTAGTMDQYRVKREMWQRYTMKYRQLPPQKVWEIVQRGIRKNCIVSESVSKSTAVRKNNNYFAMSRVFMNHCGNLLQNNNNYKMTISHKDDTPGGGRRRVWVPGSHAVNTCHARNGGEKKIINEKPKLSEEINKKEDNLNSLSCLNKPIIRVKKMATLKSLKNEELNVEEKYDKNANTEKGGAVTHTFPCSVVKACRVACDITHNTIALNIGGKENFVTKNAILRDNTKKNPKLSHQPRLGSYSM